MPKVEKVCQKLRAEKVQESVPKAQKVQERKYAKTRERVQKLRK